MGAEETNYRMALRIIGLMNTTFVVFICPRCAVSNRAGKSRALSLSHRFAD